MSSNSIICRNVSRRITISNREADTHHRRYQQANSDRLVLGHWINKWINEFHFDLLGPTRK